MRLLVGGNPSSRIVWIGHEAHRRYFGSLVAPRDGLSREFVERLPLWALDNSAYTHFDERDYRQCLERYRGIPGCLFVSAPDVVGNAYSTLLAFSYWQPVLKDMGYRIALVGQDGLQSLIVPWDSFDAFFVGGTTTWKESIYAYQLIQEAKQRGKHIHMGRVNGMKRMRYARYIGCDTVDGTGWVHKPSKCIEALDFLQRPFAPIATNRHSVQPYLMEASCF